jgi:hypothetical protein
MESIPLFFDDTFPPLHHPPPRDAGRRGKKNKVGSILLLTPVHQKEIISSRTDVPPSTQHGDQDLV